MNKLQGVGLDGLQPLSPDEDLASNVGWLHHAEGAGLFDLAKTLSTVYTDSFQKAHLEAIPLPQHVLTHCDQMFSMCIPDASLDPCDGLSHTCPFGSLRRFASAC